MRKLKAFTLVELLVVIAIIALLIGILLPALSRAREQADLVADMSNMKQVYQAVLIYSAENKGNLPFASMHNTIPCGGVYGQNDWYGPNNYGAGTNGQLFYILARCMSQKISDPIVGPIPKVFVCTRAPEAGDGIVWAPGYRRTVSFNARAFPGVDQLDQINGKPREYPQRKLGTIKNSAEKIACWDAPVVLGWNNTTLPEVTNMDGWRWSWGHEFADPAANAYDQAHLDNDFLTTAADGANQDAVGNAWFSVGTVRYRHMRDKRGQPTKTVVAYFDGHVDSREINKIKVKEFCVSRVVVGNGQP